MLEMIINPKGADKNPSKMFFIGLIYASLSFLLVEWLFMSDATLSKFSGWMVVSFATIFALPFMYYMIKREEKEDEQIEGLFGIWKVHSDAVFAFLWLFLGFVVAFSLLNIIMQDSNIFNAQLETYFNVNGEHATGAITGGGALLGISQNNISVMMIILLFSLIFGAGAIFILAWNASVIAVAVGIFAKYQLIQVPMGIARYMIHGLPEIGAYFVTALAGGILGVSIMRNEFRSKRFVRVAENSILLVFVAIILLVVAALIEVYLTPVLF